MVSRDEITRQAQEQATAMLAHHRTKAMEYRKAANDYVDELMQRTEETITVSLNDLRKARQTIKASQRVSDSGTGGNN
jgi:DNA-binding IclR family transcriptional regulator